MSDHYAVVVEGALAFPPEAGDAFRQVELADVAGFDVVDDRHGRSATRSSRQEVLAVGSKKGGRLLVLALAVPGHFVGREVVAPTPAEVPGVVGDQQAFARGPPIDWRGLRARLADFEVPWIRSVGLGHIDVHVLEVVGLVGRIGDPVAIRRDRRRSDRPLVVGDLRGLTLREVVAIEVHLTIAGRPEQEGFAVGTDVADGYLTIHLDDRLDGSLAVDRVDVVLLVPALVAVEEEPVPSASQAMGHRALRGTSPLLHCSRSPLSTSRTWSSFRPVTL